MSDRDEATGQFSSAEPLYGQAGLEHDAGYVPFKDDSAEAAPEDLTVQEAGEKLAHSSTPESEIRTYSSIAELDENVTLTIEQAAKALDDSRAADEAESEDAEADRLRKEVDELRGVDPDAKTKAATEPQDDVEKLLAIPHVKEAVEKLTGEAETARQNHLAGLSAATQMAEAAFFNQFPEFASVPPEQRMAAFNAIAQRDPARAASIKAGVENIGNLFGRYSAEHEQATSRAKTEFQSWATAEDTRFADMVKGERNMPAIEAEIVAMVKDYGTDPREFFKAGTESRLLRSATAQKILVDAAKYRLMQNAKAAVAAKPVPQVQRPGVAASRAERNTAGLAALNAKFDANPSPENAAALYTAQTRARG